MSSESERWQKLNAYVDGELDPAEAAELAAQVASDRRVASTVATLTRLKAATAAAALDGAPPALIAARAPRRWRWAVAATVAALVVAGALRTLTDTGRPDARVVERHLAWADQDASEPVDSATAARVLVGLGRLGVTAEIPDLTDAGLHLARIAVLDPAGGAAGLHIGYVGTRGCRVSLIIERSADDRAPVMSQPVGAAIARWVVDGAAYTLVASGMHPPRFATIAASAEAATRSRAQAPAEIREALRGQRDASPPCVG